MNRNFQYVVDLIQREIPKGTMSQTIVWPFYCWSAVVPEQVTAETPNIFEQLYISIKMLSKELDPKDIFSRLNIGPELYKSVEKSCEEDGYDFNSLKERNNNLTSIKIFKDAVVGKLIPELMIKDLPKEYKLCNVDYKPDYDSSNKEKPDVYEIEKMLRLFKINKRRMNEENVLDIIDDNEEDGDSWDDEVDEWNQEPMDTKDTQVVTLDEAEECKLASMIQIDDIYPELVWVRSIIYIDPIYPDIVRMLSPFKNVPNGFFDNIIALANRDKDFQELMMLFKEDMLEKYKDSVAFNNDYDILVLKKYPMLSNYTEYADIKHRITDLYLAKSAIVNENGTEYDTFFNRCGKLLEALFHHAIYCIRRDDLERVKKIICKSDFSYQITNVLDSLGQQNISKNRYFSFKNVYGCLERKIITPKSAIITLALYTEKVNREKVEVFLENPKLVYDVYEIYDIRNKYNHNSDIDSDNRINPQVMLDVSYGKMMRIIGVIAENFLEAGK